MTTPQIQKIREVCEKIFLAREQATPGPWFNHYCHIDTANELRNSQPDVTDNGTYEVGEFYYHIADVEVLAGDTPTIEGHRNSEFIVLAANHSSQLAKSLLIAVEALEKVRSTYDDFHQHDKITEHALEQITSQLMGEE